MIKEKFLKGYELSKKEAWRQDRRFLPIIREDIPTFIEAPLAQKPEDLHGADAVILGIPFEGWTPSSPVTSLPALANKAGPDSIYYRTGSIDAPGAIRKYSIHYSINHCGGWFPELDRDLIMMHHIKVMDYGDVNVDSDDPKTSWKRAIDRVSDIVRAGAVPFILGGDHAVPYPVVRGILNETSKKIGILSFDSHFDLSWEPEYQAATQWARIFETGEVDVTNFVQIGIRGHRQSTHWKYIADSLGHKWFTITDVKESGIVSVMEEAIDVVSRGTDAIYISLDIDVMDPAYVPAQKFPDPVGLSSWEMIKALRMLSTKEISGFDVSCLGPQYDLHGIGTQFVAKCIVELLGGMALRKKKAKE